MLTSALIDIKKKTFLCFISFVETSKILSRYMKKYLSILKEYV